MADIDSTPERPAFCPHCGARLADWASFCTACGQAVGVPPAGTEAAAGPTATRAEPAATRAEPAAARTAIGRREALITLAVLGVAAAIVVVVALSGRLPLLGGATVPAAGEIWFGESYDAQTFVISTRWTSTLVGRPMAAVAHLTTPVSAGQATLHIALDGTIIADQPLNGLTGSGDLIGLTFTPPDPGSYTFTITGSDGAELAVGSISAS